MSSSESVARNRAWWDRSSDDYQGKHGEFIGASDPRWGMWQIPESELGILGSVTAKDVLELGCGAAQWSIALHRLGARPVGLDNSPRQLDHARRLMAEAGVDFPLVHAAAESVPLADASFDVVFCDHGGMTWGEPHATVREAARLLRPGGRFAFSHSAPFSWACYDEEKETVEPRLHNSYFGMYRYDEPDGPTEFNLPCGEWIQLFRANGFRVEALIEIRPPEGAATTYLEPEDTEWSRSWPMEEIWVLSAGPGATGRTAVTRRGGGTRGLTDHAARNRESWAKEAANYVSGAERNWARDDFRWGMLAVPETELGLLGDVSGKDVVELGCGTAYISAWLARLGARVVGVDVTEAQLATARAMQEKYGLEFPLIHASAEDVPLADASFDLVVSEYGASIWCDPDLWIAEASRLLRLGGELVFLVNGTFLMLTTPDVEPIVPAGTDLLRPYFGMKRFEWTDDDSIDFHLGYGDWIRVLGEHGFEVERLVELRNPGHDAGRYNLFTAEWAERWPAEEIWKARKTG